MEIQFSNAMELFRNKVTKNLNLLSAALIFENSAFLKFIVIGRDLLECRINILLEDDMVFVD